VGLLRLVLTRDWTVGTGEPQLGRSVPLTKFTPGTMGRGIRDDSNCAHDEGKCEHDHSHGGHSHGAHNDAVTSVSIVCAGLLDLDRINDWLGGSWPSPSLSRARLSTAASSQALLTRRGVPLPC
jgi:hypothetical protein